MDLSIGNKGGPRGAPLSGVPATVLSLSPMLIHTAPPNGGAKKRVTVAPDVFKGCQARLSPLQTDLPLSTSPKQDIYRSQMPERPRLLMYYDTLIIIHPRY